MKLGEAPKSDAPAQPEALLARSSLKSRPASFAPAWSPPSISSCELASSYTPLRPHYSEDLDLSPFWPPLPPHCSPVPPQATLLSPPPPLTPVLSWPAGMGCTYTETAPWLFPLLRMPFTKIPAWLASRPPRGFDTNVTFSVRPFKGCNTCPATACPPPSSLYGTYQLRACHLSTFSLTCLTPGL